MTQDRGCNAIRRFDPGCSVISLAVRSKVGPLTLNQETEVRILHRQPFGATRSRLSCILGSVQTGPVTWYRWNHG